MKHTTLYVGMRNFYLLKGFSGQASVVKRGHKLLQILARIHSPSPCTSQSATPLKSSSLRSPTTVKGKPQLLYSMSCPASAPSNRRLEGKVAIITGGANGIGESTVRLFWTHGAKVVIGDIQDDRGQALAHELDSNAMYIHCDVTNEDDVRNMVDQTVEKFGKLDIMYNNAGIAETAAPKSILTIDKASFERVLNVNLVGGLLGTKHAARVMVPARKGCILFTGSATASIACTINHSYVASKCGVAGLARNVSAELGQYGVRVNCISPYAVATDMMKGLLPNGDGKQLEAFLSEAGNLKGGVLRVDDVAQAALFLASDEGSYVSGLNLVVDGGFSVANPSVAMALSRLY